MCGGRGNVCMYVWACLSLGMFAFVCDVYVCLPMQILF